MKFKLTLTTALLVLALVCLGYAQVIEISVPVTVTKNVFDWNLLGGGARARAMGGAFFAVSDDPSAGSWNPAGLTQLDKYQMGAALYFVNPKTDYTQASSIDTISVFNFKNSLKQTKSTISFGSVVLPFKLYRKELVGSIVYNRASDIYDKRTYNFLGSRRLNDFGVYYVLDQSGNVIDSIRIGDKSEEIKGGLDVVTLSLGGKLLKDLSLGLGINIYTGSYQYSSSQSIRFTWDPAFDTLIVYQPSIKGSYSGANFTFGAMYKYQDLRLGAVLKTPFKLKEKDDVKYLKDIIINGVSLVDPSTKDLISTSPIFPIDFKQKLDIPLMIGFGASYRIQELTLAADLEFRNFSNSKIHFPKKWSDPGSADTTQDLNWNSLTQFRIGGEYLLHSKYGTIPLRAGFRTDPKAFSDLKDVVIYPVDFDPQFGASFLASTDVITIINESNGSKVSGNTLSFGTGIGWSKIKLDFTYEYSWYKTKMSGYVIDQHFDIGNLDKKDNRIIVNFTGFF